MKDFFDYLNEKHIEAIDRIKHMIDVDAQEYPEYKEAAMLCKFFFEYENKYGLLYNPKAFGSFYDCAQNLAGLFDWIYHALIDDGEIAFIQVDGLIPKIIFESRWELNLENVLSKDDKDHVERFNEFILERKLNIPLREHTLVFFNNVYEYIEAVKAYDNRAEENHKKAKEIITNLKA
jgi:hypothetical protein